MPTPIPPVPKSTFLAPSLRGRLAKRLRVRETPQKLRGSFWDAGFNLVIAIWASVTFNGTLLSVDKAVAALFRPVLRLVRFLCNDPVRLLVDQRESSLAHRQGMLLQLRDTAGTLLRKRNKRWVLRKRSWAKHEALYVFPRPGNEDGLMATAAALNCEVYRDSAYTDTYEKKYMRNQGHQERNPWAIMLVGHEKPLETDPRNEQVFVSFTHLIPINQETYDRYVKGEISDLDFDVKLVCQPHEKAVAILVFSLGLSRFRMRTLRVSKLSRLDRVLCYIGLPPFRIGDLYGAELNLYAGFVHHLHRLLDHQNHEPESLVLLAQNLDRTVGRVLISFGFRQLKGRSADGDALFEISISRPH
jgi:hypothetical protein